MEQAATAPTTWLGDAPEDRRRALGLVGMAVLLSPVILVAEVAYALGVPCRRGA